MAMARVRARIACAGLDGSCLDLYQLEHKNQQAKRLKLARAFQNVLAKRARDVRMRNLLAKARGETPSHNAEG